MSPNSSQNYFLKVWLHSIKQPFVFPVAEAAWRRVKRSLQTKKTGFFIFATRDGRTLALNLKYVQFVHLWEKPGNQEQVSGEGDPGINLYYPNRVTESFQVDDPVDLAKIFSALKPNEEGKTLSFTDLDGKIVMFCTEELIMLEASTVFVEEGFTKNFYQERGTLPPR